MQEMQAFPWVGKIPWRRKWQPSTVFRRRRWHPTPVLLPGKSHGQRSLVGCGPWGRKESDTTERLPFLFTFMHWRRKWQPTPVFLLGESQGQGSLVGWQAAVYGVAQSQTRLKQLRSSSSSMFKRNTESIPSKVQEKNNYVLLLLFNIFFEVLNNKNREKKSY